MFDDYMTQKHLDQSYLAKNANEEGDDKVQPPSVVGDVNRIWTSRYAEIPFRLFDKPQSMSHYCCNHLVLIHCTFIIFV